MAIIAVISLVLISFHKVPAQQSQGSGYIVVTAGVGGTYVIPVVVQGFDHNNNDQPVNSQTLTVNLTVAGEIPPPPPPPPINCAFDASPNLIVPPASSTLSWSCSGGGGAAITCGITDSSGNTVVSGAGATGSTSVAPTSTTNYTLSCNTGAAGATTSVDVLVQTTAPIIREVPP